MSRSPLGLAVVAVATVWIVLPQVGSFSADDPKEKKLPTAQELLDQMTRQFSPEVPADVDPALLAAFGKQNQFADQQLLFDILSWREFVALCWPVGDDGKPKGKLTDPGRNAFDTYINDEDVFLPDGGRPKARGGLRANLYHKGAGENERILTLLSSVHGRLGKDRVGPNPELPQAFKYPVWDQNGFMVRYEIFMNQEEYDYIVENELYNIEGQIAFSQKGGKVNFPSGQFNTKKLGAIEIKLGWKVLLPEKGDIPERFIRAEGFLVDAAGKRQKHQFGLVAMHISHKTQTSPQWAWSTFGQVDNLAANDLKKQHGKTLKPSFVNTSVAGQILPINVPSQTQAPYTDGQSPTQIFSFQTIPPATAEVTRKAHEFLGEQGSVLRYYELIGTQWPTDPKSPPAKVGTYPQGVTNKSGGDPVPVYLINPLMETYFQTGNQTFGNQEEGMPTTGPNATKPIFGTESCMGCHSSAGVAVSATGSNVTFGPPLSADFSWLLQQKAQLRIPKGK